ncbi:MAG: hypothetical protein GY720_20700 [bacterium]|nr:hypothetical protein [bacterium]
MGPIILLLFVLTCVAGIALALAGATLPVVVILGAIFVILLGAVVFGLEAIRHSRTKGDNWFVAVGHGIWVAFKTAFEFLF